MKDLSTAWSPSPGGKEVDETIEKTGVDLKGGKVLSKIDNFFSAPCWKTFAGVPLSLISNSTGGY